MEYVHDNQMGDNGIKNMHPAKGVLYYLEIYLYKCYANASWKHFKILWNPIISAEDKTILLRKLGKKRKISM